MLRLGHFAGFVIIALFYTFLPAFLPAGLALVYLYKLGAPKEFLLPSFIFLATIQFTIIGLMIDWLRARCKILRRSPE